MRCSLSPWSAIGRGSAGYTPLALAAAAAAVLRDCDCTRLARAVEVVAPEPDSAVQVGRFDVGEADHATAVYHNSPSDTAKAQEAAAAADSVV